MSGERLVRAGDTPAAAHDSFGVGSIKRIVMKDFMIHKHTVLHATAGTNFIIGANGSGKSTVVCAICLCLGGDVTDMARSSNLKGFIRIGADVATVSIVLQGAGGADVEVTRRIIRSKDGRSEWALNGAASDAATIERLMQQYSIQMDNKCMFLPQEKIGEFTELNSDEFMRSVMRSVGNNLLPRYTALLTDKKALDQMAQQKGSLEIELSDARKDVSRLAVHREAAMEFKRNKDLLEVVKLKLPAGDMTRVNEELDELRASLQQAEQRAQTLEDPVALKAAHEAAMAASKQYETEHATARERRTTATNELTTLERKMNDVDTAIEKERASLSTLRDSTAGLEEEWNTAKLKLERAEERHKQWLAKNPDAGDLPALKAAINTEAGAITKLASQVRSLSTEADQIKADRGSLNQVIMNLRARLKRVSSTFALRMAALKNIPGIKEPRICMSAAAWLDEQRSQGRLHGEVIGPIVAHIELTNPDDAVLAQQLEHVLSLAIKFGYICTDARDLKMVTDFRVNNDRLPYVGLWRTATAQSEVDGFTKRLTGSSWEAFQAAVGASCTYMSDAIICRPEVRAVLYDQARLLDSLCTSKPGAINAFIKSGLELPDGMQLNAKEGSIRGTRNSYDGSRGLQRSGYRNPQPELVHLYAKQQDLSGERAALAEREAQLDAMSRKLGLLEQETRALNAKMGVHAERKRQLSELQLEHTRQVNSIRALFREAEQAGNALKDNASRVRSIEECLQRVRDMQLKLMALLGTIPERIKALRLASERLWVAEVALAAARVRVATAGEDLRAAQGEKEKARKECAAAQARVKASETELHAAQRQLAVNVGVVKSKYAEHYASFAELPDVTEELNARIAIMDQSLASTNVDQSSVARYEAAAQLVTDRQNRVKKLGDTLQLARAKYKKEKRSWSESLEIVTKRLNERFAAGMAKMGNRGSVELCTSSSGGGGKGEDEDEDEGEEDIAATRIAVRVAFRKDQALQPLSSGAQSGGERAVSTMLFLLAMQADTPLPFRILDEINQGMDVNNERLIMENLVKSIADAGSAAASAAKEPPARRRAGAGASASSSSRGFDDEEGGGGGAADGGDDGDGDDGDGSSSAAFTRGRQLFIISPKLIPDLLHHPSMRTSLVFNGPSAGATLADSRAIAEHFTHVDFAAIARDLRLAPVAQVLAALPAVKQQQQQPGGAAKDALALDAAGGSKKGGGGGGGGSGSAAATVPRKRGRPAAVAEDDDGEEEEEGGDDDGEEGDDDGHKGARGGKRARGAGAGRPRPAAAARADDDFDDE